MQQDNLKMFLKKILDITRLSNKSNLISPQIYHFIKREQKVY